MSARHRQTPSSRYAAAAAAAKRAPTEQLKTEQRPASQRTTAKQAPAPAPAPAPTPAAPPRPATGRVQAPPPKPAAAPQGQQKAPSSTRIPAQQQQQQQKAPSSARLQKQTSSNRLEAQGTKTSSSRLPAHGSARLQKGASARAGAASSSRQQPGSSRRLAAKGKGGKLVFIIGAALVVLGGVGALAWKPVMEGMKIKAMDAAKTDPGKMDAALKAADDFVVMVGGDQLRVKEVVVGAHGPVEVQIHLAQAAALLPQLVSIAEREALTPAQRAAALKAATAVYDRDKHAKERLPNALGDWCADAKSPDEVAAAALELVARADREDAVGILARVAGNGELSGARVTAALDGLAQLVDVSNCGEALSLFAGPMRSRGLGHTALKDAIAKASSSQVDKLVELAFSDDHQVRVFALACLGDHGALPDSPNNEPRRNQLAARFAPILNKKTDPDELAGAIKSVKRLALAPDADQLLDLATDLNVLALPGVDQPLVSEALGKDFILTSTESGKAQADAVVKKCGAALSDAHKRVVAAGALKIVTKSDLPSVRPALDQLAAVGDKDCIEALKGLVGQAYARADIVKANGDSAEAWKKWLASEHQQSQRIAEIDGWLKEHPTARVSDGQAKLQAESDYLEKAQAEVKPWVSDAKWAPPLGVEHSMVEQLNKRINMLIKDVKPALAGAKQGSAPKADPQE